MQLNDCLEEWDSLAVPAVWYEFILLLLFYLEAELL